VKFRQQLGTAGIDQLFALSVRLHGQAAEEAMVLVDTTVQERAFTYPTDSNLAIKIINHLNKLAKRHGMQQRHTYVKEVKSLRLAYRHFRHAKRGKARKALKRLRTIAGILMRKLQRTLPASVLAQEAERFARYERVLSQKKNDNDKVYSLHVPDLYCVSQGKDHKPYEYGRKASVVSTLTSQVIVGVESHDEPVHDSKTLESALAVAHRQRQRAIELAVVDRGYRGAKQHVDIDVLLPGPPLKRDSDDQRQKKRILCRKRAAIEPIIGHLKHDYRLSRNWLKGSQGDAINLLMAATAWNLRKWLIAFFLFEVKGQRWVLWLTINANQTSENRWYVAD
jgi:IS5 family transposase